MSIGGRCLFPLIMILNVVGIGIIMALGVLQSRQIHDPLRSTAVAGNRYDNLPAPEHELLDNGWFSIRLDDPDARVGWLTDNTAVIRSGNDPVMGGQANIYFWDTESMRYKYGIYAHAFQTNEAVNQLFIFAGIPLGTGLGVARNQAQMRDLTTGELLYELDFDPALVGSTIYWVDDNTRIMGIGAISWPINVWNAGTGSLEKTITLDPARATSTFVYTYDKYFVASLRLDSDDAGYQTSGDNVVLHIINISDRPGEVVTLRFNDIQSHIVVGDILYVVNETNILSAYDLTTEEVVFSTELEGFLGAYTTYAEETRHILFYKTEGMLHGLSLSGENDGKFIEPLFEMPFNTSLDYRDAYVGPIGGIPFVYQHEEPLNTYTFYDLDPESSTYGDFLGQVVLEDPKPRYFFNLAKHQLALVQYKDNRIEIIDYIAGETRLTIENTGIFQVSPDYNYVTTELVPRDQEDPDCNAVETTLQVIDFSTLETVFEKTGPNCNLFGAWSTDGDQLAIRDGLGGFTILPVTSFTE